MQATPSTIKKSSYQQSQQEAHEDDAAKNQGQANYSNLNTSANTDGNSGRDDDGSASGKEADKKPAMVSKPVKLKLEGISSEITKPQTTPTPISPRGIKPMQRLQLPDTGKNPKSPRSPRTDQTRNVAENVSESPGRDDIIKMADSITDAYRAFGSPRKEQPTPRRLESRRDLDKPLAEGTLEKTEDSQNTTALTTTNAQASTATISATLPATEMTSRPTMPSSDSLAAEATSDFSASITQINNQAMASFADQIQGNGALPDETGYQPGQIFIKVKRKISMPKVFVPASNSAVTPSVQPARNVKYSKQVQMELLADMLVAECTADSISPSDMGSISQNNVPLNLNQLPVELSEFNSYLKEKNKQRYPSFIQIF